jgi:predicted dehydrogenase
VDFDAVSNVTPGAFHAPLSLQCLKAGKHVLCEKPLALKYPDALRMVAAARKARGINMVTLRTATGPASRPSLPLVRDL